MATLYHYTSVDALARIVHDRALTPHVYGDDKVRPAAVYCMAEDVGTPWMGNPRYAATTPEAARADKRLVRFTVRVPDVDVYVQGYSGVGPEARLMRVVFRPIPENEWLSVTKRAHPGARWQPVTIPLDAEAT
jgi:hypothetical protein